MELAQDRVHRRSLILVVLILRLKIKVDLKKMGCDDGRRMELAQDRVQWRALIFSGVELKTNN
jgi:hypothetical protein